MMSSLLQECSIRASGALLAADQRGRRGDIDDHHSKCRYRKPRDPDALSDHREVFALGLDQ